METILAINPGSTSTKIAVYKDETPLFVESIAHSLEEVSKYENVFDQYEFRLNVVIEALEKHGVKPEDLTCVVSRCGLLPPINSGAYNINEDMIWQLQYNPDNPHASNVGAPIAYAIGQRNHIPALVYDGITVNELIPLTKISGLKSLKRKSMCHHLNMHAAAIRWEKETGRKLTESNLILAHLGGGITLTLRSNNRVIDGISDEEGPFAPERVGAVPTYQLVNMCYSGDYPTKRELMNAIKGHGGLIDHLGTNDTREVEKMIADGDEYAKLVYEAMALSVAKNIATLATTVYGKVDGIVLTGGIAFSEMFTKMVIDRVSWIAPVSVFGGENEMESLAFGALRVLRGEEPVQEFTKVEGRL